MKHYFLPLFCLMLGGASLQAQTNTNLLQPKVQEFQLTETSETLTLPESYNLVVTEGSCPHALEALKQIMPNKEGKSKFQVIVGKKGDKAVKSMPRKFRRRRKDTIWKSRKTVLSLPVPTSAVRSMVCRPWDR